MATTVEVPWSDAEKLILLSEILKGAKISPGHLLTIIKDAHIEPNWSEIPLPNGRSLNSCKNAFQTLLGTLSPSPPTRRKPTAPTPRHQPSNGSPNPKKRPYTVTEAPSTSRSIQPRPIAVALNGESPVPGEVASPFQTGAAEASDPNQPPKKKRGRPTKAETEAKRQAALARGEVYPPPKTPKTPRGSISGGPATAAEGATEPNAIVAAPMAVMTPPVNPFGTPGTSGSGMDAPGTAGKKRRGRPTKAEAAAKRALLEAAAVAAGGPGDEVEPKNDEDNPEETEEPAEFEVSEPDVASKPVTSAPEAPASEGQPAESAGTADLESHNMELDQ